MYYIGELENFEYPMIVSDTYFTVTKGSELISHIQTFYYEKRVKQLICMTPDQMIEFLCLFFCLFSILNNPLLNFGTVRNTELISCIHAALTMPIQKHQIKADTKSYKSLETAAIFYSSETFLKQGIS